MESPPSSMTWSENFLLSDDSGLLLSSDSNGTTIEQNHFQGSFNNQLGDSDCEDKSLSQVDSLDGMSDIICSENFNTLKKPVHCLDLVNGKQSIAIEPPEEFQDKPLLYLYENLAELLIRDIIHEGIRIYCKAVFNSVFRLASTNTLMHSFVPIPSSSFWPSDLISFGSPPSSKRSLHSSRLYSSHNSLLFPTANKIDDSNFITQAVSDDTLASFQMRDVRNPPFDSSTYSVPKDVKNLAIKRKNNKQKRAKNGLVSCTRNNVINHYNSDLFQNYNSSLSKRHSVAGSSAYTECEPVHIILPQVRHYLQQLYSDSSQHCFCKKKEKHSSKLSSSSCIPNILPYSSVNRAYKATDCGLSKKNAKWHIADKQQTREKDEKVKSKPNKTKKSTSLTFSLKQAICNIFKFRRFLSSENMKRKCDDFDYETEVVVVDKEDQRAIINRALPPLPSTIHFTEENEAVDFGESLQKVKDYGWYWGPISGEAAEKILSNEPDGSFIVRDSSDHHYIFSLTFKLNSAVRHVRIEHFQGNFSFGTCTKFKSQTIVEFIENAVEHSRSGRYLFFLHRRPVMGPVRVQLLHPVSRFKQIQSLQHMCRFVILKIVRRDLVTALPLPRRMVDYLSAPQYYSEHFIECDGFENEMKDSGYSLERTAINGEQESTGTQLRNEFLVNQ